MTKKEIMEKLADEVISIIVKKQKLLTLIETLEENGENEQAEKQRQYYEALNFQLAEVNHLAKNVFKINEKKFYDLVNEKDLAILRQYGSYSNVEI